jgi:hypothetical protein
MADSKTTQPTVTDQKGNFVIFGEKAQEAANYTSEKLHTAGVYIAVLLLSLTGCAGE